MPPLTDNVVGWRIGRIGEDDFRDPKNHDDAFRAYRKVLMGGGQFDLKLRGQEFDGPLRDIEEHMDRVAILMPKIDIGDVIQSWREDNEVVWSLRKTREEVRIPIIDTMGNDHIDKIATFAYKVAGANGNMGICNRRKIDGTTLWSEHSPWDEPGKDLDGANAIDLTWKTLKEQEEGVRQMVAAAEKNEIPMGYIISNRRQWKKGEGWSAYGGLDPHTGHAHAQGLRWHNGETPRAHC